MTCPRMMKLAALRKVGLYWKLVSEFTIEKGRTHAMMVVDICMRNGLSSVLFFALQVRAAQPIISPMPPTTMVGMRNQRRHQSASTRWTTCKNVNIMRYPRRNDSIQRTCCDTVKSNEHGAYPQSWSAIVEPVGGWIMIIAPPIIVDTGVVNYSERRIDLEIIGREGRDSDSLMMLGLQERRCW